MHNEATGEGDDINPVAAADVPAVDVDIPVVPAANINVPAANANVTVNVPAAAAADVNNGEYKSADIFEFSCCRASLGVVLL